MTEPATAPPRARARHDADLIDTDWREPELQALSEGGDVESTSGAVAAAAYGLATATGQWSDIRRRFLRNKLAVVGLAMVAVVFVLAIFAPRSRPTAPRQDLLHTTSRRRGSTGSAPTDRAGPAVPGHLRHPDRLHGRPGVDRAGPAASASSSGSIAGYLGRFWDSLIMRICRHLLRLPAPGRRHRHHHRRRARA